MGTAPHMSTTAGAADTQQAADETKAAGAMAKNLRPATH